MPTSAATDLERSPHRAATQPRPSCGERALYPVEVNEAPTTAVPADPSGSTRLDGGEAKLGPLHEASDQAPPHRYTAALAGQIEGAWQDHWERSGTFHVANPVGSLAPADGSAIPADKMFVQDMFPYPSGDGLHVGHPLGYIATDVYARYFRMTGHNVLHALGMVRAK